MCDLSLVRCWDYVKLPYNYNNSKRNRPTTGMGHNCLHVRFFLLDLDSDLDLRSVDLDLDLDLPSLNRTWTCSLKVDLDLDFYCCWTCYKSAKNAAHRFKEENDVRAYSNAADLSGSVATQLR